MKLIIFILVILLSSCKVKSKLIEPTVFWANDSIPNNDVELHLYNEWE